MYVAVKGGERAIEASHRLLEAARRGDPAVPELSTRQVSEQLPRAVDRVMAEGSLYDRELAALAIRQAAGDLVEAIFLLRAYRTTLPRLGNSEPVDTARMLIRRRISATFKDIPGGQILGPTPDYTHRLLDFRLADIAATDAGQCDDTVQRDRLPPAEEPMPRVMDLLGREGLVEDEAAAVDEERPPADITREPLRFPAGRDARLQVLARGDEGFLLALGYASQRGFSNTHPFAGEIRYGLVAVAIVPEELGFAIEIGEIELTEVQMVNQFAGSDTAPPQFTRGYGLVFGHQERKAMSMALVDRSLRGGELGEEGDSPTDDEEFVLYHSDNVEASGFVQHLKLPHYVDFQSELELLRRLRSEFDPPSAQAAE